MSQLIFPTLPGMAFPVVKTPMWRTKVQEAVSGAETRIGLWSYPKWKWSLTYELLRDNASQELWQLLGFFNRVGGSYDDWLFLDPDDNSVTDHAIGTGNGSNAVFQIARAKGGFSEPLRNFVGTPVIKAGGVVRNDIEITARGQVAFDNPPANGAPVTWTGSYYWRCRFTEEYMDVEKFARLMWQASKIEFVSVK